MIQTTGAQSWEVFFRTSARPAGSSVPTPPVPAPRTPDMKNVLRNFLSAVPEPA